MAKSTKCNHTNKQHTWQGELDMLHCVKEKGHKDNHESFAKVLGKAVSDKSKHPGNEFVNVNGIDYIVDEQLVGWGDEEGEDLK